MGKYFKEKNHRPRDYWPTVDPDAISPDFRSIVKGKTFAEPCYGGGHLVDLLSPWAKCEWKSDLEPQVEGVRQLDALKITEKDLYNCALIITNPPYSWDMLQPLLEHLPTLRPTWFLLPADFMHNKRSSPYMGICPRVLALRRLYWITEPDVKPIKGKDNYCWYQFYARYRGHTTFYPRGENEDP